MLSFETVWDIFQKSINAIDETALASAFATTVPRDQTRRKKVTGICYICNNIQIKKRRKTRKSCVDCNKPICDEHSCSMYYKM